MATLNVDKLFYLFMGKPASHDPPVSGSNNIYPHSINDLNEDGMLRELYPKVTFPY